VNWITGLVRAQLPGFFHQRQTAQDDLTWCAANTPNVGLLREVDFHFGKLALADGDQVKAQDYLRQSGYKVSISPLSSSHHFPKTRCQATLSRRSGSRKLFRAGSMRCRDLGQRVSGRPAFLSDNRLFRVNQRGRKYPLHAGKGLFTSGVRSATGRFALRAFAYARYWELA
jgi:hypothetical protein